MYVEIKWHFSTVEMNMGELQCSVIGPILFIIYLNWYRTVSTSNEVIKFLGFEIGNKWKSLNFGPQKLSKNLFLCIDFFPSGVSTDR